MYSTNSERTGKRSSLYTILENSILTAMETHLFPDFPTYEGVVDGLLWQMQLPSNTDSTTREQLVSSLFSALRRNVTRLRSTGYLRVVLPTSHGLTFLNVDSR